MVITIIIEILIAILTVIIVIVTVPIEIFGDGGRMYNRFLYRYKAREFWRREERCDRLKKGLLKKNDINYIVLKRRSSY